MLTPGSLLDLDWYKTQEGKELFASLLKGNNSRRIYGLLEKPLSGSQMEEFQYKIFLVGKSGVGKTCTLAKLSANQIPATHCETAGMQTTLVYWPVKISRLNKIVMFQLNFWDAGENSLKKFDHVLPSCTDKVDALLFLFSFVDKSSFDDLPGHISRLSTVRDNTAKLILGTHFDQYSQSEVSQRDIRDFESHWDLPIMKIRNVREGDWWADLADVAPVINTLSEHIWHRDICISKRTS